MEIISYPLFADADTGIYPHAALQYHARPKARRGIAMLSVDRFPYPRKQTRGNEFIPCSNNICDILTQFRSFKIPAITLIWPKSPYKHSVTRSYRCGKESGRRSESPLWRHQWRSCVFISHADDVKREIRLHIPRLLTNQKRESSRSMGWKTISRPSHLHNAISYTGNTTSLYWIRMLVAMIDAMGWTDVFSFLWLFLPKCYTPYASKPYTENLLFTCPVWTLCIVVYGHIHSGNAFREHTVLSNYDIMIWRFYPQNWPFVKGMHPLVTDGYFLRIESEIRRFDNFHCQSEKSCETSSRVVDDLEKTLC